MSVSSCSSCGPSTAETAQALYQKRQQEAVKTQEVVKNREAQTLRTDPSRILDIHV